MGYHSASISPHVIGKTILLYHYTLLLSVDILCNAIEPPLTLQGPRGLLAYPIRCIYVSGTWETASLRKTVVNSIILSVMLENSPDLSSSVHTVFQFEYIDI